MNRAAAALRLLRGRLHARAFDLNQHGHREAAQGLWALVDELDYLIDLMSRRRR